MELKNRLDLSSDHELIAAINDGDEAAFETLYYRHRDWVVNLAYRWTGDRDLAMDVLQETFFSLAKRFPGFRLTAKLQTFLYPVVRNISVNALRKSRRSQVNSVPTEVLETAAPEGRPADGDEQLQVVLAALGPEHRDVLVLRFVDELSLAEIAEVLGIPLGTVKSRLHNALGTLRRDERTKELFER
jgi:RNA polymerase sigma-70 factor (ECF subfamily)